MSETVPAGADPAAAAPTASPADTVPSGPRPPRQHPVIAAADPITLGSMLFTLVEPHRGQEVAYNRWYERDHFYAGCMIGPWQFAGKRWVATADLKQRREPDPSVITGEPERGSYLALYWILDGHHDEWNLWAVDQVKALHRAGRMFDARDHVHTLLYRYLWSVSREEVGVPAELALDHPYAGLVACFVDAEPGVGRDAMLDWLRDEHLPSALGGGPIGLALAWQPLPLHVDVPGVARSDSLDQRTLLLLFLDESPAAAWDRVVARIHSIDGSHRGSVVATLPFIPTIPGTDTYTDELWTDA